MSQLRSMAAMRASVSRRERGAEPLQLLALSPQRQDRLALAHLDEAHPVALPRLSEPRQVRSDDGRDLGVTARGLGVDGHHDGLTLRRYLHGSRAEGIAHDIGAC